MKGIYLVSEAACLNPRTGAGQHIQVGLQELRRDFEMELVLFCKEFNEGSTTTPSQGRLRKRSPLFRFMKWWYLLLKNHLSFFKYLLLIRRAKVDFIFERASYLNFNGWIISKLLGKVHFYEVNGILAHDNAEYYPAVCNRLALALERRAYRSTRGFFVGGLNKELGIIGTNATIIQNGIDESFLEKFSIENVKPQNVFNIVFVGHAMSHHRLDVLARAFKYIDDLSGIRLHLVGSNMQQIRKLFPHDLDVLDHGSMGHDDIALLLQQAHAGIIPYSKDYFSHVKLFMYGAARLAVILPFSRNYNEMFQAHEVLFVNNGDPEDIAVKIQTLRNSADLRVLLGNRLHDKVAKKFTWPAIYAEVRRSVQAALNNARIKPAHEDSAFT